MVKSKKGTPDSPKKGVGRARPWPDLPQQLVHLIARQSTLMQNITAFGGVTKSWKAASRKCNPTGKSQWPQLSNNGEEGHEKPHLPKHFRITIHEGYRGWYRGIPPWLRVHPWEYFVGCSHGLLAAKGVKPLEYFLWAPKANGYGICVLPPWDEKVPFTFVVLSSHWDCSYPVVMVLTGISSPAFLFCRIPRQGEYEWVRQDNTLIDPYGPNQSIMHFSNAIGFVGKFYALSLQGNLAVIEDLNDSQLTITALSKHRAVPSVSCKHFRECLVESFGEILLVFLISKKTFNIVDHVEVFRLHFPKLSWVKMESLGVDVTLFIGANCCMSVDANNVGCRRDCIYFSQLAVEGWWVYDMQSDCISTSLSNADLATKLLAWDEQAVEE